MNEQQSTISENAGQPLALAEPTPDQNHPVPGAPPPGETIDARAGSLLSKLNWDQQLQLIKWLETEPASTVCRLVADAPPKGFGLNTSETAIRRLRARMYSTDLVDRLTKNQDICERITEAVPKGDDIASVTLQILQHRVFEMVKGDRPPLILPQLVGALERLTSLQIKRERLQLDRERMAQHPPQRHQIAVQIMPGKPAEKTISVDPPVALPPNRPAATPEPQP
jgi:hypothetical protein